MSSVPPVSPFIQSPFISLLVSLTHPVSSLSLSSFCLSNPSSFHILFLPSYPFNAPFPKSSPSSYSVSKYFTLGVLKSPRLFPASLLPLSLPCFIHSRLFSSLSSFLCTYILNSSSLSFQSVFINFILGIVHSTFLFPLVSVTSFSPVLYAFTFFVFPPILSLHFFPVPSLFPCIQSPYISLLVSLTYPVNLLCFPSLFLFYSLSIQFFSFLSILSLHFLPRFPSLSFYTISIHFIRSVIFVLPFILA